LAPHAEHDQTDATAIEGIHDPQQVRRAPGKAIWFTGYQRFTSADEAQNLVDTITLRHGEHLL
jgi:hypothetical protein